jgi:uncharacterized protein YaaQ
VEEEKPVALLLVAIVHQQDADRTITALNAGGHRVTRLPSMGGFLGTENTTLLVGIEDAQEQVVLDIFERACAERDIEVPLVLMGRLKDEFPRSVHYGGATIFILDVRNIVHLRGAATPGEG